ncbi:hypothetical protein KR200_000400, partial [Drosophila serrata]
TETWPLVDITTAAAIPSPATTEITSAPQHGSTAASTANINAREDLTLDLLDLLLRITARIWRTITDAREAVKSLLIHPGNVSAVMGSQLNNMREMQPISELNLAKIVPFATQVSNLMA